MGRHPILLEGFVVGMAGAAAVTVWFLVVDGRSASSEYGYTPRPPAEGTALAGRQVREIQKSEAGGGIEASAERRRRLYEHDLQRGPDMGLEEVAAQGGAIEAPHHDAGVDSRVAVFHGDVPHEG